VLSSNLHCGKRSYYVSLEPMSKMRGIWGVRVRGRRCEWRSDQRTANSRRIKNRRGRILVLEEIVKLPLTSIRYYQNIGGKYRYFPIKYREKNIADIYRYLKKYRDIEIFFATQKGGLPTYRGWTISICLLYSKIKYRSISLFKKYHDKYRYFRKISEKSPKKISIPIYRYILTTSNSADFWW